MQNIQCPVKTVQNSDSVQMLNNSVSAELDQREQQSWADGQTFRSNYSKANVKATQDAEYGIKVIFSESKSRTILCLPYIVWWAGGSWPNYLENCRPFPYPPFRVAMLPCYLGFWASEVDQRQESRCLEQSSKSRRRRRATCSAPSKLKQQESNRLNLKSSSSRNTSVKDTQQLNTLVGFISTDVVYVASRQNCSDSGGDVCLVWPSPVFQAALLCHYHVPPVSLSGTLHYCLSV